MKYEDLPKNLRDRVDQADTRTGARRSRGSTGTRAGHATWTCANCHEHFTTWAQVERHDPTHTRIECDLEAVS